MCQLTWAVAINWWGVTLLDAVPFSLCCLLFTHVAVAGVFVSRVTSLLLCGWNKLQPRRERATESLQFFVKIILWFTALCMDQGDSSKWLQWLRWKIYFPCKDVHKGLFTLKRPFPPEITDFWSLTVWNTSDDWVECGQHTWRLVSYKCQ